MNERFRIALLLAVSALLYVNVLGNAFTFDDGAYIFNGPGVVHPSFSALFHPTRATNLFRPATFASFSLNWALAQDQPFGYHLVNLLLHMLVVFLLYRVLCLLLDPFPHAPVIAFAAALLFAVHPIHTEAVASIVGRSELLAAGLLLAAWLFHLRDRPVLMLLSLLLAFFSKESSVAFIALAFAGDFARQKFKPLPRYASIAALTALYIALLWKVQGNSFGKGSSFLDNPLASLPAHLRVVAALGVAWKYVALQLFPLHLSCDYSFNAIPLPTDRAHLLFPAVTAVFVLALWGWTFYERRYAWFLAGAIYLAGFAVTANILLPTGTILGERLAYLPSAGLCLVVALLWSALHLRHRTLAWLSLAALAAVLSFRTVTRNTDWRDNLSLFSSAVRVVPGSARAHCNLGAEYLARGEYHSAFQELQTALQIYPDYPDALADFGVLQQRLGDNDEARRLLERAVSLARQGTLDRDVLSVTLASHLMRINEDVAALGILTQVISDWPGYARAWSTRAVLRWKQGNFEAARSDAQRAFLLDPTDTQAQRLLSDLSANPR